MVLNAQWGDDDVPPEEVGDRFEDLGETYHGDRGVAPADTYNGPLPDIERTDWSTDGWLESMLSEGTDEESGPPRSYTPTLDVPSTEADKNQSKQLSGEATRPVDTEQTPPLETGGLGPSTTFVSPVRRTLQRQE